jgi:hypothetical protein
MLSKSDYLKFLQCIKYVWLYKHRRDLLEEASERQQAIFNQGFAVEDYAERLFPNGKRLPKSRRYNPLMDADLTHALIRKCTPVIFQPTAIADFNGKTRQLFARADIIVFNPETKCYDIYEVKGTTEPKDVHLPDLCFQKLTFQKAEYKIGKTFLIHLNSDYVKNGEIDPKKLLTVTDLTKEINDITAETEALIPQAIAAQALPKEPQVRIVKQCTSPYECPFIPYCWPQAKIPEYSIYNLTGVREKQLTQLLDLNILKIKDIPKNFDLTKAQEAQVKVEKTGKPIINRKQIAKELSALKYPLYFLDYETVMPAIPLWDGTGPYRQVCFQYSLHVLDSPASELRHFEYLAKNQQDPVPELLNQLREEIPLKGGTVIVWNKSFEMGRNKEMAERFPEFKKFLESVNARVYDLIDIFKHRDYVDPAFRGSCSIKNVLPALVPELSYKNLEDIRQGDLAGLRWLQATFSPAITQPEKSAIRRNLLKYCERDTLAMVKILETIR